MTDALGCDGQKARPIAFQVQWALYQMDAKFWASMQSVCSMSVFQSYHLKKTI